MEGKVKNRNHKGNNRKEGYEKRRAIQLIYEGIDLKMISRILPIGRETLAALKSSIETVTIEEMIPSDFIINEPLLSLLAFDNDSTPNYHPNRNIFSNSHIITIQDQILSNNQSLRKPVKFEILRQPTYTTSTYSTSLGGINLVRFMQFAIEGVDLDFLEELFDLENYELDELLQTKFADITSLEDGLTDMQKQDYMKNPLGYKSKFRPKITSMALYFSDHTYGSADHRFTRMIRP